MEPPYTKPKTSYAPVGLGISVLSEEGKLLVGKRKDCDLYAFPGGHLEHLETWEQCAKRELKEETDLDVEEKDFRFYGINNTIHKEKNYHYVVLFLTCKYPKGQEIVNLEPHKCYGWEWWSFEDFEKRREEIFYPIRIMLEQKEAIFNKEHLKQILSEEKIGRRN